MLFRRALRKAGLSFRTSNAKLSGKPDFTIRSKNLAVFIDGDFWHGRQWALRKHASLEDQFARSATAGYWLTKIRKNIARDLTNTGILLERGWNVARFWEADLNRDPEQCVDTIAADPLPNPCSRIPQRTVAEFFAGIGLMRYAFERQGWRVAFANDIDSKKLDMYAAHFGHSFHLADVHQVNPALVPPVSLATASFPCTDLSLAGGRKGLSGTQSSAFWGFLDVLKGMGDRKPPLVLIENVPGFVTSAKGEDLHAALLGLNSLGY